MPCAYLDLVLSHVARSLGGWGEREHAVEEKSPAWWMCEHLAVICAGY